MLLDLIEREFHEVTRELKVDGEINGGHGSEDTSPDRQVINRDNVPDYALPGKRDFSKSNSKRTK